MRIVCFKLQEELLRRLDTYAVNHRLYRSEVIRFAIEFFLSNYDKSNKTADKNLIIEAEEK